MNPLLTNPELSTWILSGQIKADEPIRNMRIERLRVTVGRKSTSDLTIPSPSVSGTHAVLSIEGEALYVTDLDSTNGTFVNGVRITDRCRIQHGDLIQFAETVFRARQEKQQVSVQTVQHDATDQAMALIQFDKLISDRAVAPHYQPIVEITSQHRIGYELLGRSGLFGLSTPQAMFTAAAVLDLEAELSRVLRFEGLSKAEPLPGDPILFVNTHPIELTEQDSLLASLWELRESSPSRKVVLEIHEAAVTNVSAMRALRSSLRELEIGLAYDDFGAGQARLVELVEVPPDYLKFDIALIREIHLANPIRKRMLRDLVRMASDLGISALAEGVETVEEHDACLELGFALAQGFLYGKPNLATSFV